MSPKVYSGQQGKNLPQYKIDRVLQLLREGVYGNETARRADVSEGSVRTIAKRHGIVPARAPRGPQPKRAPPPMDEARKWRGLAYNARWSVQW